MKIIRRFVSQDGTTVKYLQQTDGSFVETCYIRQERKHIICASVQVGCVIGCKFCASGLRAYGSKYIRSLTAPEIVRECLNVQDDIQFGNYPVPLLFSFMGEGEPFLNFEAFVGAAHFLERQNLPVPIRFAVSTSGIRPDLIRQLGKTTFSAPFKLQVSLHAPNDKLRKQLIPHSRPVREILDATADFQRVSGRSVDLVYVLCDGLNDSPEHAYELVALLGPGWHVKFNRLNQTPGTVFRSVSAEKRTLFRSLCEQAGITTEYYETNEGGVQGGCGQLAYSIESQLAPLT